MISGRSLIGLLCAGALLICPESSAQGRATLVSVSPDGLIVDYAPASYKPIEVTIDGTMHVYYVEAESSAPPGEPGFPLESFAIGIPSTGGVRVSVLEARSAASAALPVAPVASQVLVEDAQRSIVRSFEPSARTTGTDVSEVVSAGAISWLRDQRIAAILVRPIVPGPSGMLITHSSVRIRITFENPAGADESRVDPLFEPTYRSLLVNYDQARFWRRSGRGISIPAFSVPPGPTSWPLPGGNLLRIKTATMGVSRIPFEHIQASVPPASDPRSFDLYYKGRKIPFTIVGESDGVFGPGDTIEFWSTRLRDTLGNADEYSDTSVYWLSFAGNGDTRTTVETGQPPAPDIVIARSLQTIRAEKDSFYYFGDLGLPANNVTERAAGEGWYWRRLRAGQNTTLTLDSRNFYRTGNPTYTLRGRLHSPVAQVANPNHNIEISLNGNVLGTVQFSGYSDTVFTFGASSTLFLEGANAVRFRSLATGASVNEVFIDWLEADVEKELVADADTLVIVPAGGTPGQIAEVQVSGFSDPDMSAYRVDPDNGLDKQFAGILSGSAGDYAITFRDTLQSGHRYVVLTGTRKTVPPIIEEREIQDLRSTALGADYLIITGRALLSEANRLAQYRGQQRGWRTLVVDVEDIYDQFSFGHFNPEAIRSFLAAADSFWIPPKPAYVMFFGDANWDVKDNLGTGKTNIVPSYGNPVSDSWFVENSSAPYLPQKLIGRVPVRTLEAAQAFVDMVIAYEATGLSVWNKTFMFMASGFNATETQRFLDFSDLLINQSVTANPIAGRASRLYKTVTNVVEFEQTEEVLRMLDEGAVWINFYGHAGTELWGNGIGNASQLVNAEGKRHLVSDVSCSTVRFAEPLIDSFGESLLLADEGGAAGYFGSSGFGFESPLRVLAERIFLGVSQDTIREPGVMVLNAKTHLWQTSSGNLLSRQALRQFSFLGDPAMQVRIARKPDFAVVPGSFATEPESPSEADQEISVTVPVMNLGLAAQDSLTLRWTHTHEADLSEIHDRRVPAPRLADTVRLTVPGLRRGGTHNLTLLVDSGNDISEESEANNTAGMSFFVTSGQLQIIRPLVSSVVHPDSVALVVQNPNIRLTPGHRLAIEIDTSENFTGPGKLVIGNLPLGSLVTTWSAPAGLLSDATEYFWRARVYEGTDSTDWVSSYFRTSQSERRSWAQQGKGFRRNTRVEVSGEGPVRLLEQDIGVEVRSTGFNHGNEVWVYVGGVDISLGFTNRGYNVAVVNQFSGEVEAFAAFDIGAFEGGVPDTAALAQFLEGIPAGRWVLAAISDEAATNKTERINQAFESIGSASIRSVTFRASWAIIGRKGAAIGSVLEEVQASGIPITLTDTLHCASILGTTLTDAIGPAAQWRALDWNVDTTAPGTSVSLDIIRLYDNGASDTLKNVTPGAVPIGTLLPQSVRSIRLAATLASATPGVSPLVNSWSVDFDAPAELTVNYQTVALQPDSVLEGEDAVVAGSVYNIGDANADSVVVAFSALQNNNYVEFSRLVVPSLSPGASVPFTSGPLSTTGLSGSVPVLVFVDPDRKQRESFGNNNAVSLPLVVRADTVAPAFQVTFDGLRILDGDHVRPDPEIQVLIRDNSPLPITDPANVDFRIDGKRITLGASPDSLFEPLPGPKKARVTVRPTLTKGPHTLTLQVLDASGNPADTTAYELRFQVETATRILNVFNFPNPFSSETAFTFHLTGAQPPEEVILRIYTVAGRLIYERTFLPGQVHVGFNRIVWDGRDQNGDAVANGVYFYKVTAVGGGERVEVVEKVARMR